MVSRRWSAQIDLQFSFSWRYWHNETPDEGHAVVCQTSDAQSSAEECFTATKSICYRETIANIADKETDAATAAAASANQADRQRHERCDHQRPANAVQQRLLQDDQRVTVRSRSRTRIDARRTGRAATIEDVTLTLVLPSALFLDAHCCLF